MDDSRIRRSLWVKFLMGPHFYIENPADSPSPLTTSRDKEQGASKDEETRPSPAYGRRCIGYIGSRSPFTNSCPTMLSNGICSGKLRKLKADQNISLPHNEAELALVERILGYKFTNKGLLELALTAPAKGDPSPSCERLEFVGDAVLEIIAVQAWICQGSVKGAGQKTQNSVNNLALLAVCINAGLRGLHQEVQSQGQEDHPSTYGLLRYLESV